MMILITTYLHTLISGRYYQVTPTAPAFVQPTNYGAASITIQPSMPQTQVIIIGGCPACRVRVKTP